MSRALWDGARWHHCGTHTCRAPRPAPEIPRHEVRGTWEPYSSLHCFLKLKWLRSWALFLIVFPCSPHAVGDTKLPDRLPSLTLPKKVTRFSLCAPGLPIIHLLLLSQPNSSLPHFPSAKLPPQTMVTLQQCHEHTGAVRLQSLQLSWKDKDAEEENKKGSSLADVS